MNISTNMLLNMLSPNMTSNIKDKIEKLSVDGKVDIPTLIKDKSIQTLISGLFKDISTAVKTKSDVAVLLSNNKNSFSFRNLTDDIKSLVKFLQTQSNFPNSTQTDLKGDSKILNQISVLRESLVDIKNLDAKMLKENISNSGVFLESKLLKDTVPLSDSLKILTTLVQKSIDLLQTITKENTPASLKLEIKTAIANILKDIKTTVAQIENKLSGIKPDILDKIKVDIQNISTTIKTLETAKTPLQQNTLLKDLSTNIKTMESNIFNLTNRVNIENNLGITKNISRDIKTTILQIQEQISGSKDTVSNEIKATVEKILSQVEYFQLLSYSSNSNHTYLSFLQDNIEDVDIKFNSSNDDSVSCQINLSLKKQGELKVLLVLDKKYNLNINMGVEDLDFKQKVQNGLQKLRVGINNIGLVLQSLNVFDINENSSKNKIGGYGSGDNINFGLDIKA